MNKTSDIALQWSWNLSYKFSAWNFNVFLFNICHWFLLARVFLNQTLLIFDTSEFLKIIFYEIHDTVRKLPPYYISKIPLINPFYDQSSNVFLEAYIYGSWQSYTSNKICIITGNNRSHIWDMQYDNNNNCLWCLLMQNRWKHKIISILYKISIYIFSYCHPTLIWFLFLSLYIYFLSYGFLFFYFLLFYVLQFQITSYWILLILSKFSL